MQLLRAVWTFGSNIDEMVHLWKLYCLSVLEQSCVVWGPSLTKENQDDLERTQKGFAKLVLGHKYNNYESALLRLNLVTMSERRIQLMTKFAKISIENRTHIATGPMLMGQRVHHSNLGPKINMVPAINNMQ